MKKLFSIVLIVLALASCDTAEIQFKVSPLASKDSTEICTINTKLPVLSELNGKFTELCERVNSDIKNKNNSFLLAFKKDAYSFYKESQQDTFPPSAIKYEYFGDYNMFFADAKSVSLRFINYQYTGGAHGMTMFDCYNYDVKTAKELKFSDVFKSDEEAISKINALLLANFKNPEKCFTTNPTINSTYKLFNIQKDTVMFTFAHYELGAYACGIAEVEVPIVKLIEAGVYKR
jgi:hypothetical protein